MLNSQPYVFPEQQASFIQTMLDASMHGILLLEPVKDENQQIHDFLIRAVNASIEKHTGILAKDAMGCLTSALFPAYKKYHFFDVYLTALESGKLTRKELYYKDDRTEGWFDLGVAPHEDMLVVTFVNITETKTYQQSIQRYAAQLYTVIDICQSGMFLFSAIKDTKGETVDFKFTMANKALAAYVGQQPEALIGEKGSKWFPAYKHNGLFKQYRHTYETGQTNRFEFHYNADNIDVWLDIMSTKFEDEVLVTFTDYTAVKKLQLQLESYVNELKRSNTYLQEFAYAASHDLQEPLRKIQFYSDKIKLQIKKNEVEESHSMLERMDSAANRMRILIDDLLAYSQLSSEKEVFKPVNLNALVREVIADLETMAKEKSAVISVPELPTLIGDKRQLYQLFINLLSNALKYSREGVPPEIRITTTLITDVTKIPQTAQEFENRTYHLIEVTDNGLGFEQQYSQKIFHIFQRLHGRSEYPGTGVGLAIVQKVIENHNGSILAEGELGKGATFKCWLPA